MTDKSHDGRSMWHNRNSTWDSQPAAMAITFEREIHDWRDDLGTALRFLTRLPLRIGIPSSDLSRAVRVFPVVGILVGLLGALAGRIADGMGLPALASALVAVGATVLLTGALHEDGLADTADGFGGGASRERKLEIMRDSRSGAYGVLALVFSVGLRAAAVAALIPPDRVLGALAAAHAVSRGLLPAVMRFLDPARSDGLGARAGRPEAWAVLWSLGIAAATSLVCLGAVGGLAALFWAAAAVAGLGTLARRQIGGYTGDVLGAAQQVGEIVMLLSAAAS
jgi:adenosylcobinamide-GDP ribazoletransferase